MTDTLDEVHAQQALAALIANPAILAVFDGPVTNPTPEPPYVVVYTSIGRPYGVDGPGNGLDMTSKTITTHITCKCVGLSAAAARVVGMQVRTSLLDFRPVISGRICGPIHSDNDPPPPPEPDESTDRLVMVQHQDYVFTSTG